MTERRFSRMAAADRERLRPAAHPDWIDPMLATLTDRRFSDEGWLFERKLDGIRCLAFRHGDDLRLLSRNKVKLGNKYPEIVDGLLSQPEEDFVVDGEIVAFQGGRTSFELLQGRSGGPGNSRARRSAVTVRYYIFDIMHLDGNDTRALALRSRKQLLRQALVFGAPLWFVSHRTRDGEALYASACEKGWEGVIAKRADSVYSSRRSPNWLKFKCVAGQELVVGGFTEPAGSRFGFGALLVGYYDNGELRYAGKVGTGFDERTLRELRSRLGELEIEGSPFVDSRRFDRGTHFVEPVLVAEVGFTEWTRDGLLRQPRFVGLREDKPASLVTRERPGGSGAR